MIGSEAQTVSDGAPPAKGDGEVETVEDVRKRRRRAIALLAWPAKYWTLLHSAQGRNMRDIAAKVGLSMLTAVAGGVTWIVAEPEARDLMGKVAGVTVGSHPPATTPANAAHKAAPAKLDLTPNPDAHPSFDCSKARSTTEKLICTDPALAEADVALEKVWKTIWDRNMMTDDLRYAQRQWVAKRDACLIDDDPKTCVKKTIFSRINELAVLPAPTKPAVTLTKPGAEPSSEDASKLNHGG